MTGQLAAAAGAEDPDDPLLEPDDPEDPESDELEPADPEDPDPEDPESDDPELELSDFAVSLAVDELFRLSVR